MNAEKKVCLFLASLTLVLILLSASPAVVSTHGITSSPSSEFSPSAVTAPPETSIDLTGTLGLNNWFTTDVTVTFTVIGAEPEFTTAYSFDLTSWVLYTGPFVISTEGSTTLYYNSTDGVGRIEETKKVTLQIDKAAPELTLETEAVPGQGVLVTLTVIEDVSYLVDLGYSLDGVRWLRYPGPILLTDEGIQPFYYRALDAAGNTVSKLDYIEVVIPPEITPTEVTYTGDTSGVYSDPINLEAVLIETLTGLPIADRLIVFTVGSQTASAVTDADGVASTTLILDQPAGLYEVTAVFEGDEQYLDSSASSEFTLLKEDAFAYYSGLTIIDESNPTLTLQSTVFDDVDGYLGDLTRIYLTFTIYLSSDIITPLQVIDSVSVSTTDIAGVGISTVEIPNLPEGEYLVIVSIDSEQNPYYWAPDSDPAVITIYQPGRESARGAGWIEDADGNKGHFVFLVKHSCRKGLSGFVYYRLRIDNLVYVVWSTEITGFTVYDNHAFFEASIAIYAYDLETGEAYQLEDGYRLRIDVWDYKKRHGRDIFQIQIFDKYGLAVYEAGVDPVGYLCRGNIVIHGYRHYRHHWHYWHHRCRCHKHKHW